MALPPTSPRTEADQVQIRLLREASPTQRFLRCRSMSSSMIGLARRAIQAQNPGMSDQEVGLAFVSLHYGPKLAADLRKYLEGE